jgi:hypothetical protein
MAAKKKPMSKAKMVNRAIRDRKFLDSLLKDLTALKGLLKKSVLKDDKNLIKGLNGWITYLKKVKKIKGTYTQRKKAIESMGLEPPDAWLMMSIKCWPPK